MEVADLRGEQERGRAAMPREQRSRATVCDSTGGVGTATAFGWPAGAAAPRLGILAIGLDPIAGGPRRLDGAI